MAEWLGDALIRRFDAGSSPVTATIVLWCNGLSIADSDSADPGSTPGRITFIALSSNWVRPRTLTPCLSVRIRPGLLFFKAKA